MLQWQMYPRLHLGKQLELHVVVQLIKYFWFRLDAVESSL